MSTFEVFSATKGTTALWRELPVGKAAGDALVKEVVVSSDRVTLFGGSPVSSKSVPFVKRFWL